MLHLEDLFSDKWHEKVCVAVCGTQETDERAEINRGRGSRLAGKAAHEFPKSLHVGCAEGLVKLSEPPADIAEVVIRVLDEYRPNVLYVSRPASGRVKNSV